MTSAVKESESGHEEDQIEVRGFQGTPICTQVQEKGIESDIFSRVFFVPYQDLKGAGKVNMRSGRQSPATMKFSQVQK